ncbi:hypothetical protein B0J13DRAFT_588593 [Dactylonectria estremocensis]|uniref:Zn(2)-C6 fungal-type domain-containing protein n=1 Tax=Dactylonectria estremocensis TaxID=1079267 RepID=A0A9P9DZ47_9HYPO|nr:hypothetical protein B0J13DRAFT_588593 [Dactylonectria estremocensis]
MAEDAAGDRDKQAAGPVVFKSRGPTACEKCRARKTRCDNQRPTCGYCSKNELSCVYAEDTIPQGGFAETTQLAIGPRGMDTILEWNIFNHLRPIHLAKDHCQMPDIWNHSVPNMDYHELSRLERKYINGVHLKNPILDLSELHDMVIYVAENGLDWSIQTCLVTLVCAIGAATESYQDQPLSPTDPLYRGREPDLSIQFWTLAAKRLGFVIGQSHHQAVQCLLLAGIWYMHQIQPLHAWKYFNLAGAAWHSINLVNTPSHNPFDISAINHPSLFTVNQALFFTIWKSEWELRLELPIPTPILNDAGFPNLFALAPSPGIEPTELVDERTWYYYLADIAARHLINRVLRLHCWTTDTPSEAEIHQLVVQSDIMEAQIQGWHASLPSVLHFDIPEDNTAPLHSNDTVQILRYRYFSLRELVGRPFVQLYVNASEPLSISAALRARVLSLAAQSAHYSMLKLSQVAIHRHHGTWFTLRNVASAALVLWAIDLAHRRPWSSRAQELVPPEGWKLRVYEVAELLQPYWNIWGGAALAVKNTLQLVIDAPSCD